MANVADLYGHFIPVPRHFILNYYTIDNVHLFDTNGRVEIHCLNLNIGLF